MNKFKTFFLGIFSLLVCNIAGAQDRPEMADVMRSNGKIYVVVAVCLLILLGLFFYVWTIDRKITKIEKQQLH